MKKLSIWLGAVLLIGTATASAQTDALVVDETGNVGISYGVLAPDESLEFAAALAPPFLGAPRKCRRIIPVRIVVSDAATGAIIHSDQGRIDESARLFTATLTPTDIDGRRVQAGVLTARRLYDCIGIDISAVDENGAVRQLVLDLRVR